MTMGKGKIWWRERQGARPVSPTPYNHFFWLSTGRSEIRLAIGKISLNSSGRSEKKSPYNHILESLTSGALPKFLHFYIFTFSLFFVGL
jgi:hypothetical protein